MKGIYWYVSRPKIEALRDSYGRSPVSWLKDLSLTIKAPFVEVEGTIPLGQTLFREMERIEKNLLKSGEVEPFVSLADGPRRSCLFFSFNGAARRTVQHGAYWIVMRSGPTALLMVGSTNNAIGTPPKESAEISPSMDPIGAVKLAFPGEPTPDAASFVSNSCSYTWAAIAEPVRDSWDDLPHVEGIATYGERYRTSEEQMRSAGFEDVREIIIGSPIFVRQI